MKTNHFLILAALIVHCITMHGQTIQLQNRVRQEQLIQLKCSEYENDVDSVPIVAAWTYDMQTQELVLELIMRRIGYDRIWFPQRHYEWEEVKRETAQNTNWFSRLFGFYNPWKKPFKRQSVFGVDNTLTLPANANCRFIPEDEKSFEEEMIANGGSSQFRFTVIDPTKDVIIVLKGVVPVSLIETPSEKKYFRYHFMSDPVRILLSVPSDPCMMQQNKNLFSEAKCLYNEMQVAHENLINVKNNIKHKDVKKCKECLDAFQKLYVTQYEALKNSSETIPIPCDSVMLYLQLTKNLLDEVGQMECPTKDCEDGCNRSKAFFLNQVKKIESIRMDIFIEDDHSRNEAHYKKGMEIINSINQYKNDPCCKKYLEELGFDALVKLFYDTYGLKKQYK